MKPLAAQSGLCPRSPGLRRKRLRPGYNAKIQWYGAQHQ